MTDNPNAGYFQSSKGSISGFTSANLPNTNPDIIQTGWSVEDLRRYLLNVSDVNFPSNEWLISIEQMIRDHEEDYNNPHRTTLDQIVGNFVKQILGNITAGTVPEVAPFYSFDAAASLPMSTVFPATFTSNNLYRRTPGGWFIDPATESDVYGTDYLNNKAGLPLFSNMTNVTPSNWSGLAGVGLNTTLVTSVDATVNYPFAFKDVQENPVTGLFGIDLPVTQDLQISYTSSFFIKPSANLGKLRIYQPSDIHSYVEIMLDDGSCYVYADNMAATSSMYADGIIKVSVNYTSSASVADGKLRIIHLNTSQTGDGTRVGSFGRLLFSIAVQAQTTRAALNQPILKNLESVGSTSPLALDFSKVSAPITLSSFIVTISMNLFPLPVLATVTDSNIMSFGSLVISRDQTKIKVSVGGTQILTSDILDGLNNITLSYSPTTIIFKDLPNDRQTFTGTYAALPTASVTFGPFGGYLNHVAFYAQEDRAQVVEYLNNG